MVARSILSALLFTVACLELAVGATILDTKGIELEPRAVDATLEPRQWQSVGTSSSVTTETSVFVQQWSTLPPAFAKCQAVFLHRASVQVAVQAAIALRTQVQSVYTRYGSCSACDATTSVQFERVVTQVFTSWQSVLVTGSQSYGAEWDVHFKSVFEGFAPFVSTMKTLCVSFNLDLSVIIGHLSLNLNVFVGVGINIGGLLGGVTGLLGNVLSNGLLRE